MWVTGLSSRLPFPIFEYLRTLEEFIDQTMLKIESPEKEYLGFVEISEKYKFRAIVVPQTLLPVVVPVTRLRVATVVGFPNGYSPLEAKLAEIDYAAGRGAKEVDVVMNIVLAKSGKWDDLFKELSAIVNRSREYGVGVKIIIETSVLKADEIAKSARLVEESGADYVKTNTGFGPRGVLPSDVVLIKSSITGRCGIKASGGIRTAVDAALLLSLGASIIGTSHGVEIAEQARRLLST